MAAEGKTAAAGVSEGKHAGVEQLPVGERPAKIAVLCVGNKLMLDDGVGPAVYEELVEGYEIPGNVELYDIGCLSMVFIVDACDFIITVDAVDGTGAEPGTVFRFQPDAMARHTGANASLHDLKLIDLFDAATLLGYSADGLCLGMQVENSSPAEVTIGLTPKVYEALPLIVETLIAEVKRKDGPSAVPQELLEAASR